MTNDEGMTEARMTKHRASDFVIRASSFSRDMTKEKTQRILQYGQS